MPTSFLGRPSLALPKLVQANTITAYRLQFRTAFPFQEPQFDLRITRLTSDRRGDPGRTPTDHERAHNTLQQSGT
jgi:hypothetical protein